MIGIVGHGAYVPRYRIKAEEYVEAWGSFSARNVEEKSVAGYDEDSVTMGIEAARNAISSSGIDPSDVDVLYLATTTPLYAEKLSSCTVAESVGAGPNVRTADFTNSTKSGTTALLACLDAVLGSGGYGLVVASDFPFSAPGDPIEHGFGAGAASFVIGEGENVTEIEGSFSASREVLGERFRKVGKPYTRDLGIRIQHYPLLIEMSIGGLREKLGEVEIDHLILQQPNGRLPIRVARRMGFKDEQLSPNMLVNYTGDTGVSSTLLSLANALDRVQAGERILMASYGSSAGSDAISFVVGNKTDRGKAPSVQDYLDDKEYIDYVKYLKFRGMLPPSEGE